VSAMPMQASRNSSARPRSSIEDASTVPPTHSQRLLERAYARADPFARTSILGGECDIGNRWRNTWARYFVRSTSICHWLGEQERLYDDLIRLHANGDDRQQCVLGRLQLVWLTFLDYSD